jgi:Spy/CpxP family protein refolding chaperone
MQLKLMPLLMGAIALTGSFAAITLPLGATPLTLNAQANRSGEQLVAQVQPQRRGRFAQLNLTQSQKDQLAQIRKETREQIKGILSKEQQDKYEAARQNRTAMKNRQERRAAFAAMNLSESQKTQIRALKQSAKSKIEAILTAQQRQQLQQLRQQRRQQQNKNSTQQS